jgi:hypothetical protein
LFIPTDKTLGQLRFHGTVTGIDSLVGSFFDDYEGGATDTVVYDGKDTLYFSLAKHTSDGTGLKADEAESYTLMDSALVSTAKATATFDFNPMTVTAFRQQGCRYYTLKIYRTGTHFSRFWIEIERMNAYKKY